MRPIGFWLLRLERSHGRGRRRYVQQVDEDARRAWIVPPASGDFAGVDLSLLDADDEDERALLIEAEHPELASARRSGRREVKIGGRMVSPGLHLALHQVVAQQIWDGTPSETWLAAKRLTALGHDRHDVLHMLMFVIGEDVRRAVAGESPRTSEEVTQALKSLPAGWADGAADPT